jgi:hypothetical protein
VTAGLDPFNDCTGSDTCNGLGGCVNSH